MRQQWGLLTSLPPDARAEVLTQVGLAGSRGLLAALSSCREVRADRARVAEALHRPPPPSLCPPPRPSDDALRSAFAPWYWEAERLAVAEQPGVLLPPQTERVWAPDWFERAKLSRSASTERIGGLRRAARALVDRAWRWRHPPPHFADIFPELYRRAVLTARCEELLVLPSPGADERFVRDVRSGAAPLGDGSLLLRQDLVPRYWEDFASLFRKRCLPEGWCRAVYEGCPQGRRLILQHFRRYVRAPVDGWGPANAPAPDDVQRLARLALRSLDPPGLPFGTYAAVFETLYPCATNNCFHRTGHHREGLVSLMRECWLFAPAETHEALRMWWLDPMRQGTPSPLLLMLEEEVGFGYPTDPAAGPAAGPAAAADAVADAVADAAGIWIEAATVPRSTTRRALEAKRRRCALTNLATSVTQVVTRSVIECERATLNSLCSRCCAEGKGLERPSLEPTESVDSGRGRLAGGGGGAATRPMRPRTDTDWAGAVASSAAGDSACGSSLRPRAYRSAGPPGARPSARAAAVTAGDSACSKSGSAWDGSSVPTATLASPKSSASSVARARAARRSVGCCVAITTRSSSSPKSARARASTIASSEPAKASPVGETTTSGSGSVSPSCAAFSSSAARVARSRAGRFVVSGSSPGSGVPTWVACAGGASIERWP